MEYELDEKKAQQQAGESVERTVHWRERQSVEKKGYQSVGWKESMSVDHWVEKKGSQSELLMVSQTVPTMVVASVLKWGVQWADKLAVSSAELSAVQLAMMMGEMMVEELELL